MTAPQWPVYPTILLGGAPSPNHKGSKMSWEVGYDCGYYEGLRNAIRFIAMNIGTDVHAIIKQLAEMRDDAYAQHFENIEEDEKND